MSYEPPEWVSKPLSELNRQQWEALCDGCGKCCMAKLQDQDTDKVYYTNVACELFDADSCRCQDYQNRQSRVPDCISLSVDMLNQFQWLPQTCAYRLRAQDELLPEWHPLISGNSNSVHCAGVSVKNKVVPIHQVEILEHHLVDWD